MPDNLEPNTVEITQHPMWHVLTRRQKYHLLLFTQGKIDVGHDEEPEVYEILDQNRLHTALDKIAFVLGHLYREFHEQVMSSFDKHIKKIYGR
jgi:hypothetical protein